MFRIFFSMTVFLLLLSCGSYQKKFEFPRTSFVHLRNVVVIKRCEKAAPFKCKNSDSGVTGSGSIIKRLPSGSYVLTAAHVCVNPRLVAATKKGKVVSNSFLASDITGRLYKVSIVATSPMADLCLLFADGLIDFPALALAKHGPHRGDVVYNMAAPRGIFSVNMIPLFSGYYSGSDTNHDLYTIPATSGSSGSPVLNADGEVVGVITMAFEGFTSLSLSPSYNFIRAFLQNYL